LLTTCHLLSGHIHYLKQKKGTGNFSRRQEIRGFDEGSQPQRRHDKRWLKLLTLPHSPSVSIAFLSLLAMNRGPGSVYTIPGLKNLNSAKDCDECGKPFTFLRQKYHCKNCGKWVILAVAARCLTIQYSNA
jgi:hypothetical protein